MIFPAHSKTLFGGGYIGLSALLNAKKPRSRPHKSATAALSPPAAPPDFFPPYASTKNQRHKQA